MGQSVTVTSTTEDGQDVTITIEATGADTGTITATTAGKPEVIKLSKVHRIGNSDTIRCRAKARGLDLDVQCALKAPNASGGPSVSIVARVLLFTPVDDTYPLDPNEYEAVRAFLAANFP
jgi:hypothetical protein